MLTFLRRVRYLLRRRAVNLDLTEEIETHRLMVEDRLRRSGISADDARAASRRVMGNTTLAREDARAAWLAPWVESVVQDIAYALRTLGRAPAFAGAMIVVMALGIGTTTGVFALIDALVL